jgi:hypothetical protein
MKRWVIAIALLLGAPLVQPAAAHARASTADGAAALPAMCGDASQTLLFSPAALWATEASRPGAASHAPLVAVDPADDGQTAWCVSSDDPRCAPRDLGAPLQSQRSLSPLCEMGSVRPAQPPCFETQAVTPRAFLGAPRAGVSVRLDRPPRA